MSTKTKKDPVYDSPLRYPGGKGKLLGYLKRILIDNSLSGGHYAEAYAGGASIALGLLFDEIVRKVHINDIDEHIWAFWESVLKESDAFCQLIEATAITVKEWERQRDIYDHPEDHSTLEIGFSTFFLNRVNRSGILTGGLIGGKNQTGTWKLDARFKKDSLISRIKRIARYKDRIALYNLDAEVFLTDKVSALESKTLVYLDPPYYHKGQELYTNFYTPDDHARIASLVTTIHHPWIISYDWCPEIEKLYSGFKNVVYKLNYSAQDRYHGNEVMIFSEQVAAPDVADPRKVKRSKVQPSLSLL